MSETNEADASTQQLPDCQPKSFLGPLGNQARYQWAGPSSKCWHLQSRSCSSLVGYNLENLTKTWSQPLRSSSDAKSFVQHNKAGRVHSHLSHSSPQAAFWTVDCQGLLDQNLTGRQDCWELLELARVCTTTRCFGVVVRTWPQQTPTTTSAKHLLVMVAAWCAYIACGWTTKLGHPTHANSLMILTSVLLTSLDTLPMRQIVHMLAHGQQAGDQALGLGPHKRHKQAWICSHGASNELQSTSFPNEWSREPLLVVWAARLRHLTFGSAKSFTDYKLLLYARDAGVNLWIDVHI